MADSVKSSFVLLLLAFSLFVELTFAADSPEISPAPSLGSDADSPPPITPTADVPAPQHAPGSSPPAPSPETPSPGPSPNPSPGSSPSPSRSPSPSAVPAPAPADSADVKHTDVGDDTEGESSGGMSPRKKAGIAVGVIAAGCVVGLAGIVYKKRQQNIRRSQFGYAARREIL